MDMQTRAADQMRQVPLFARLAPGDLDDLARQARVRRFGRNEVIFAQGDPGDGLYIVLEGQVAIGRINDEGGELILAIYEPGEYFGDLALFDGAPRSAGATALTGVATIFLDRPAFRAFLDAHPAAVMTCLEVVVRQLRRLTEVADEIALMDVRRRLARRLLRLSQEGALAPRSRTVLRVTQQQLAAMLGATRENVNKHLNALVDAGAVRLERGRVVILDEARLRRVAEGLE